MRTRFLLLWCFWAVNHLHAQEMIQFTHSCSYDGEESASEYYTFDPSSEADQIVQEICTAVSLEKNFIVKSSNVSNALATVVNKQRIILYNTDFLEKFKDLSKTRWAAYSVLAHEIGHHLNGHDLEESNPIRRKSMELQADKFSGGALRLLGASLEEAQAGLTTFALSGETQTHPPSSARREAVASGWKLQDEQLKKLGMITKPTPAPASNPAKITPADTDNDGTPDDKDACPTQKGPAEANGCPKSAPDVCYAVTIQSDLFGLRNRALTREELNSCNQCTSWVNSDGSKRYEDLTRSSCRLKKRIDEETEIGYVQNGETVTLLGQEGSFFKIRTQSGKVGYIAYKYAGISSLTKTTCD